MRLKLLFAFFVCLSAFITNAQDVVYYRNDPVSANWDWGGDCNNSSSGGNWSYSVGGGLRMRPDCFGFNRIIFNNTVNTTMNLNSGSDYSVNQIQFVNGTPDRTINTDVFRRLLFQNNNGNCKIENYATFTTHTFNVPIIVNSGNMEINPVNGFLSFNSPITNNSSNPINIYGAQQVTFSGDISGNQGITINNTATAVYSGVSKTYSGTTTINSGATLKISSNQTLGNIDLKGGILVIDSGATLTLTGTYTPTGGTINNLGTIKFAGGSVTFPGSANVNNGTANTLTSIEAATSGTLTLNTLLRATGSVAVSSGTFLLSGFDLRLSNANLNIAAGATFDIGGENQVISDAGTPTITIWGTFITRDAQGFVGTGSAIPGITPTLNAGCTIEYGLSGAQAVQGSRSYSNLTISNSGTKTLSSAITNTHSITGTVLIKDAAILDVENKSFGGSGTNLTMTGTAEFRTAGTGVKPDFAGTYTLGIGTKITFSNTENTLESIRLAPKYYNIDIIGTSVGTNTENGSIDFQSGGTLTVKSAGTFKFSNTTGLSGGMQTAISNVNNPTITLEPGSTIEYFGANQTITSFPSYSNLTISGTGIKTTTALTINIGNDLNIKAAQLTIKDGQGFVVANNVNNIGGSFIIENNGSLVQVNDSGVNSGIINYQRKSNSDRNTDYTYWSTPVSSTQTLSDLFPKTLDGMCFSYEVTSSSEDWKRETSETKMAVGKGYIVRGPEPNQPFPPSYPTATFIGTPNNGIHKLSGIFQNKSYLIGNPYPSALFADAFLNANSNVLDGTLYFWTHNTNIQLATNIANGSAGTGLYAYTSDDYASYNGVGGTVAASGGTKPSGKIASAQGFFVSSNATIIGTNEIIFNNSMRLDNGNNIMSNSQFFKTRNTKVKTASAIEKHRIWLNLTNTQGAFKQTLIGYITDATNEYDSRFDGESFDANEFVDFYSLNQNKNLVIQGRALPFNENDEVPLGFRTTIEGAFTINIDQVDGLLTNQAVFIEDQLTNTLFDLRSGNYTFNTAAGTFNDRFILRYTNKTLGIDDVKTPENQVLISNKNKQIKVNSEVEPIDKVVVYDLLGRQLFKKDKVNSNEFKILNLVSIQQTLLVKVTLQNGSEVTRKVLFN